MRLAAAVQPALIPLRFADGPRAGQPEIVMATGEFAGRMVFSGYGAGGDPTAVAVVSDLYSIARSAGAPAEALPGAAEVPIPSAAISPCRIICASWCATAPASSPRSPRFLSKYEISLDALLQKPGFPHSALPFVMTLEACDSAVLDRALEEIARLDFHVEPPLCLPIFLD